MLLIGSHQGIALAMVEEMRVAAMVAAATVVAAMAVVATVAAAVATVAAVAVVMEEAVMVVVAMGVEVAVAMAVVRAMQMMVLAVEHMGVAERMVVVVILRLQVAAAAAVTTILAQAGKAAFLVLDMGLVQEDLAAAIKSTVAKAMERRIQPETLVIMFLWKVIPGTKTRNPTMTTPKEPEYADVGVNRIVLSLIILALGCCVVSRTSIRPLFISLDFDIIVVK